ncbi:serine hydrolase [Streptomyces venezuelae]|uniref:Serine hydrolase n=1 Tax=Streptomyces venezuelae TaxID=54571 RepID=A0A5P2DGL2_STRVZ|nr:serine hydrolase domain-containing protein [Streptomyces venezuelae]QES52129.1 serine hydrolase [Streptomyces venezuelae]
MSEHEQHEHPLSALVAATAEEYAIPGVVVGVWADGQEVFASHGVTSLDNPLPVDPRTLYQLGSVTKTFTATALLRLVESGEIELDAPVCRYVPELVLSDQEAAARITVLNLLNHTGGLDWAVIADTGDGDDALAAYVARMAEMEMAAPPGTRASYSQAGYNLAGRVLEKVTGLTYERAVASLVLEPLGLSDTFFFPDDVMTRRFAVGHNLEDDTLSIARPWRIPRGHNPGGGMVSSVADLLRWARFHLGDGRTESGEPLLPAARLHGMKEPTVALRSSTQGDALGICWFLRDVDGVRTVGHGGSANGQFAEFLLVPERNFAVVSVSNAGPNGIPCNQEIVRWALRTWLGVTDRDPEPIPHDAARAGELVGTYDIDAMTLSIGTDGAGLTLDVRFKAELRAASDIPLPPDYPPADFGLLPGDSDDYIITNGGLKGQRGFFTRDETGAIVGIDLAGRLFRRLPEPAPSIR